MKTTSANPSMTPDQCRQALQADIDGGGLIYLPSGRYVFDRQSIIDRDDVSLFGDGNFTELYCKVGGPVIGIKRKPLSADHWPGNGAIRTCGDSHVAFQCSPWSALDPRMIISCQVTANKGWGTDQTPLFGSMHNGEPGPWYVFMTAGGTQLAFVFKLSDGIVRTAYAAVSGTSISFDITVDLTVGELFINGEAKKGWLQGLSWYPSDTRLFQIGAVGDTLLARHDYDLTFTQLSLPRIKLWPDTVPGDWAVHAYGSGGHAYGHFVGNLNDGDNVGGNRIRDMRISAPTYGQGVGIGLVNDLMLERLHVVGGEQNVGSVNAGYSYPVSLRDCKLDFADDVNLSLTAAEVSSVGLKIGAPIRHAVVLRGCNADFTATTVSDSQAGLIQEVFKMADNRGNGGVYSFRGGSADMEGGAPTAYFACERHVNAPMTTLRVEDWSLGKLAPVGSHVVLTDSVLGGPTNICQATVPSWIDPFEGVETFSVKSDQCWKVKRE